VGGEFRGLGECVETIEVFDLVVGGSYHELWSVVSASVTSIRAKLKGEIEPSDIYGVRYQVVHIVRTACPCLECRSAI
jgi:hypothetical protein